ncbi:hypothetical protein M427DRAFT_191875 [Gonapodya prolifera JEL478]|uniref:Transmembrane protein 135 N-terminal domain-containing protein n=1 Tax=Gonapodya prolifera (strain JEL478) TaxID=1344416 RepID=A0A139A039_GONPJ|nr:hypothetical protein M427DRAFT_191875 [Gonapodya prolifera JEL478]|eukprot:KXS10094.1 hypothetical protein M427DRAFT_191875 [Gonapodya prolifera JEL478]
MTGGYSEKKHTRAVPEWKNRTQILRFALTSGARTFLLAFTARAGISAFWALVKVIRRRAHVAEVFRIVLEPYPLTFAAGLGAFSFFHKLLLNLARFDNLGSERSRAFVSGGISSLAIYLEHPSRRMVFVETFGIRALQAVVNLLYSRNLLRIPHGAMLLFLYICAQIIYGVMLDPSKVRPTFFTMLTSQAYTSPKLLDINRRNLSTAEEIIDGASTIARTTLATPALPLKEAVMAIRKEYSGGVRDPLERERHLVAWINRVGLGKDPSEMATYGISRTLPARDLYCALIHPGHSHWRDLMENWFGCFFTVLPLALGVNMATTIAFNARKVSKSPFRSALPTLISASRTSAFFGSLNVIYRAGLCVITALIERGVLKKPPRWTYWAFGIPAGLSVLWESPGRVRELNVFALPTVSGDVIL